jgi:hypothetical protein
MRWMEKPRPDLTKWHPWYVGFLHRPVTLTNGQRVWLETVERRLIREYACGDCIYSDWEYRDIGSPNQEGC